MTRYRYYAICAASRGQINLVSSIFYSHNHSYTASAERHFHLPEPVDGAWLHMPLSPLNYPWMVRA